MWGLLLLRLGMLFPPLGRNAVIAQFQQGRDLIVRNRAVQDYGNPVVLIHVVCREKPFCGEQGTDHDGIALYIHYIKRFFPCETQLFREDAHHGGIPFFAGGVAEYRVAWTVGPEIFRLRPVGVLYVLRDTLTLR